MTDHTVRNQQNAQKSTGPSSVEGKARSSRNATSHGMYSQSAFDKDEDLQLYLDHKAGIFESLKPEDPLQDALVLLIADNLWRLQRYRFKENELRFFDDERGDSRTRQEQRVQSGMHRAHKELKELQAISRAERKAAAEAAEAAEEAAEVEEPIELTPTPLPQSGFVPAKPNLCVEKVDTSPAHDEKGGQKTAA